MPGLVADPGCDIVVAAIVGAAGLEPTLAAVRAGKKIPLANKEALVMAGQVVTAAARESGAVLLEEVLDTDAEARERARFKVRIQDPAGIGRLPLATCCAIGVLRRGAQPL